MPQKFNILWFCATFCVVSETNYASSDWSSRFNEGDVIMLRAKSCGDKCLKDRKKESKIALSSCDSQREMWRISEISESNQKMRLRNMEKEENHRMLYTDGHTHGSTLRSDDEEDGDWFQFNQDPHNPGYISLENEDGLCPSWDHCSEGRVTMEDCTGIGYMIYVIWEIDVTPPPTTMEPTTTAPTETTPAPTANEWAIKSEDCSTDDRCLHSMYGSCQRWEEGRDVCLFLMGGGFGAPFVPGTKTCSNDDYGLWERIHNTALKNKGEGRYIYRDNTAVAVSDTATYYPEYLWDFDSNGQMINGSYCVYIPPDTCTSSSSLNNYELRYKSSGPCSTFDFIHVSDPDLGNEPGPIVIDDKGLFSSFAFMMFVILVLMFYIILCLTRYKKEVRFDDGLFDEEETII